MTTTCLIAIIAIGWIGTVAASLLFLRGATAKERYLRDRGIVG